ncbi:aminotransferase class V-fold PLP-dependent enzyme [Agromyces hippuratus]|uniref:aminotransferase class V-fold PLP-dependent enzyme n=1 Tax=Agromyces hippuratus TaxID=286438 RepID=UPI0035EBD7E5
MPVLGGRFVRHVNLDVAASAPALEVVAQQVTRVLPYYASVHRGSGYPSQLSTSLVEDARLAVARHVGARDDDLVVFTRNTTDALNLLAGAVPATPWCSTSSTTPTCCPGARAGSSRGGRRSPRPSTPSTPNSPARRPRCCR